MNKEEIKELKTLISTALEKNQKFLISLGKTENPTVLSEILTLKGKIETLEAINLAFSGNKIYLKMLADI